MAANEIELGLKVDADPNALDDFAAGAKRGAARAGDNIVQEIERAGSRVEAEARSMADAMSRRLSDIPPPNFEDRIVAPARAAGESAGAEIADGVAGMDLSNVGSSMVDALAMLGPAGAAIGMAFGEDIATGLDHGFNENRNQVLDSIRSGIPESEIAGIGTDAGEAWSAGFGEGLRELESAGALIANTMEGLDDSLDMDGALRAAAALEEVWGVDIPTSLRIARDMVSSQLAPDTVTAYAQMADAQQKYMLDAEEVNDVMQEFSSFMGQLGMDGATAWNIVGTATRENLFPTIDRAGEMFEEFSITMQDGTDDARAAVEGLGLSWDEMQALFNAGRGDEALARIAQALIDTDDAAQRNTATLALFGEAMTGATDPRRALELYAQADAVGEVGTALEDAEAALSANESAWSRLTRGVQQAAGIWAGFASDALGPVIDGLGWVADQTERHVETLAGWVGMGDEATGSTEGLGKAVRDTGDELDETSGGLEDMGGAAESAAAQVAELDAAFAQLRGQFDGDQAIRNMHDAIRDLNEEGFIAAAAGTYELGVGFDQTSVEGGALAAQLEDLHGGLLDVAEAERNGTATSAELAREQANVHMTLMGVARQLNLTESETQELIDRYGQVPSDVTTTASMQGNALDRANALFTKVRDLDGESATVNLITKYSTIGRASSFFTGRAAGGPVSGLASGGTSMSSAMVNDGGGMAGGESAWLPGGDLVMLPTGSKVNTAEDTERMRLDASNAGSGPMVIELRSAGTALDDVLLEVLRKAIRNQGGGVLQVLG